MDLRFIDKLPLLDHGYLRFIEFWGSDERIIEAARMSTDKGFQGWGTLEKPGDEKLLRYLYEHKHATPFEFAGMVIEVQAPIFVFREWHRHRTQCLAPDTLVHFDAPKSRDNRRFVYKMRIEDIWKKWQPTARASRPERQTNPFGPRSRIQGMKLRCLDEEMREFVHTRIVDVIRGEPKPMIRVTTASGRSLIATREHRVLTNVGWLALGDAVRDGAHLALEGVTRGVSMRWEVAQPSRPEEWKPVPGWESTYEVSSHGRVQRIGCDPKRTTVGAQGYDVVSLNRPGEQVTRTVHSLVLEAFLGFGDGLEARHLDGNRANNMVDNLRWGTSLENARDRTGADRQQRLVPVFENIVAIADVGELPTYDLTVEGPWHNFAADGFVVHNSYNELSARYTPLPDLNYIPTVERLMMGGGHITKQAGTIAGADALTMEVAEEFRQDLADWYKGCELFYQQSLQAGIPKELARVALPVGRYSRMRACANLRNWLAFITLRSDPNAQWEIRQYSNAVGELIKATFPRTWELFAEGKKWS